MIINLRIEISDETYKNVFAEMYWITPVYKDVRNYIEAQCEKYINDKYKIK